MLIQIVVTLFVVGVLLWLFNQYGAQYCDAKIVQLINAVVIIAAVLWVLNVSGLFDTLNTISPRGRP